MILLTMKAVKIKFTNTGHLLSKSKPPKQTQSSKTSSIFGIGTPDLV